MLISSNGYVGKYATSTNNRVLVTGNTSLWSNSGALTIEASNTLNLANGGTVVAASVTNSGTLTGTGRIGGDTTIASGGTLTPGSGGTGSLSFTGGLALQNESTTTFLINSTNSFTSINLLGASLTYGGILNFNITSYTPAAGDAFTLFNMTGGTTRSGDFASVTAGSLFFTDASGIWTATDNGLTYQFSDSTGQLTVATATAVPEPSTYALFGLGAIGLLMAMRRKKTA